MVDFQGHGCKSLQEQNGVGFSKGRQSSALVNGESRL